MRRLIKAHLINRSNRPVYRSKPITHVILNLDLNSNRSNRPVYWSNRLHMQFWIWIWIQTISTGFRSNRSGKPLPEGSGLTGPVGIINPGLNRVILKQIEA